MHRPRFQFRLSTLLWITLAVACCFGGMSVERHWIYDPDAARDARHRSFIRFLEALPDEQKKLLDQLDRDEASP